MSIKKQGELSIRESAEVLLQTRTPKVHKTLQHLSLEETKEIVHELEVHQIELEIQNEELIQIQQELEKNKKRYFDLYNIAPVGYATLSANGIIEETNLAISNLLGKSRGTLVGQALSNFILAQDQDIYYFYRKKFFTPREHEECELRMISEDKTAFWVELTARSEEKKIHLIIKDISKRKLLEEKLELSASVFKNTSEAIMITQLDGTILDVNEAFSSITGYTKEEIIGQKANTLKSEHQAQEYYKIMWNILIQKGSWKGEIWNKRKNGETFPAMLVINTVYDNHAKPKHYVALFSDITSLKEYESSLQSITQYDQLTKLPNRVLLSDRLLYGMLQTKRHKHHLAVIFLDLDGFKNVNDTYGHEVGDKLLVALAKEMKEALREEDTLARIGGDEFVAVLSHLGDIETGLPIITRLLQSASTTVEIDKNFIQVSASLGVTFYPQNQEVDADQLLRQADQAMYQAKLSGKNNFHIFNTRENDLILQRFEMIKELTRAYVNEEFRLYYQPKLNMRSGEVIGVEALIRWQHSSKGIVAPMEFLPFIEDHPLSNNIGEWVIITALAQLQSWKEDGINIPISINIGAHQLLEEEFVDYLHTALLQFPSVDPSMLEIEVLETTKIEDLNRSIEVMNSCIKLGVSFSLDDFGTGYSSLVYLEQLPIKQIKIDQSFIRAMLDDPKDLSIIDGIISLSEAFECFIIAEGVETEELASTLIQLGCDRGQGYTFAKPMPNVDFVSWLKSFQPNPEFKTLKVMTPTQKQMLLLKLHHRFWLTQVEAYLVKKETLSAKQELLKKCKFSIWMEKSGKEYLDEKFDEIDLKHTNVHKFVEKLLTCDSDECDQEGLEELKRLSDELLLLL